ncbi:Eif4e translation initiation factor [Perkinsela sp. CCAP 1560/4]|nr:Eif4e translation initiation factor [Perkinsela sp. CCAP 1560/4]|eukprot:KNH09277.1 Eif4e translation initiation factor [Perkinsela sp. CCAP 1560/4]
MTLEAKESGGATHPLHQSWIMWYDYQRFVNQSNPRDGLHKLSTIADVEGFWNVVDTIKPASSLAFGANYHFFKDGVRPEWEDPANIDGGKWNIRIVDEEADKIDSAWERTLMGLIGEYIFDPLERKHQGIECIVTGAVLARRRLNTRIELWCNRCFDDDETVKDIECRIREIAGLEVKLSFHPHKKSIKSTITTLEAGSDVK